MYSVTNSSIDIENVLRRLVGGWEGRAARREAVECSVVVGGGSGRGSDPGVGADDAAADDAAADDAAADELDEEGVGWDRVGVNRAMWAGQSCVSFTLR